MKKHLIIFFFLPSLLLFAQQPPVRIALIHDAKSEVGVLKDFEESTKEEIRLLLQHRRELIFKDFYSSRDVQAIQKNLEEAYTKFDIVITLGILSSQIISAQKDYPKPTIGGIVNDTELMGLPKTAEGTSGIDNLVFIESPFNIAGDLQALKRVKPFKNLAIIFETDINLRNNNLTENLIRNNLNDASVNIQFYQVDDILTGQSDFDIETDAVYVFPFLKENGNESAGQIFQKIKEKGLPSAAFFGEIGVANGALIGYESDQNLNLIPRRIALNTMKLVEGQNAKDIPVGIDTYNRNLLINMATARQIGIYPDFDLMAESTLTNIENNPADRKLTLQTAIAEALNNNLDYQLTALDIAVAETEIGIAQSNQLPQIDVSTSLSVTDELSALSGQGFQGQVNWLGSAELSQVIFSEPLLANIAIQKLLKRGEEYELEQVQYDLIIEVAEAYLNILQAETNLNIQQRNVAVTKENYDIAKSKNAIGYSSAGDAYRLEAELASRNVELNAAFATVRQAKFRLNQLLNRPIAEPFSVKKETLEESMLFVTDGRLDLIDNYGELAKFTAFIVEYSKDKLPSLDLIDNNIRVQERLQLSKQRAFYLPTVALSGSASQVFDKWKVPDAFPAQDNQATWSLGLGVSYPVFQGNLRKRELAQTQIQMQQLHLSKQNIQNQLELRIRSNMETVYVSFSEVDLSRQAAVAANKNFDIIQDAYNQGQVNITTLIDAQNNTLQTELGATNAVYNFILDFLSLERSIGFFYFLASEEEKAVFFQKAMEGIE